MRVIAFLFIIILIISVFYYSWLPQPSFISERYLPYWLVKLTDEYGILRTGIPFIFLGMNVVFFRTKRLTSFKFFVGLFILLLLAEIGQLFLPERHFDIMDIIVGGISIWVGIFAGEIFIRLFKKYKAKKIS